MANHSPNPNRYVLSKTWDEALADQEPKGEHELPNLAEAVKQTEGGGAAARNGGGSEPPEGTKAKQPATAPKSKAE